MTQASVALRSDASLTIFANFILSVTNIPIVSGMHVPAASSASIIHYQTVSYAVSGTTGHSCRNTPLPSSYTDPWRGGFILHCGAINMLSWQGYAW